MGKFPGALLNFPNATPEQRHIMSQPDDAFIKETRYPLKSIDNLDSLGNRNVGPIAREEFTDSDGSKTVPIGPFQRWKAIT